MHSFNHLEREKKYLMYWNLEEWGGREVLEGREGKDKRRRERGKGREI